MTGQAFVYIIYVIHKRASVVFDISDQRDPKLILTANAATDLIRKLLRHCDEIFQRTKTPSVYFEFSWKCSDRNYGLPGTVAKPDTGVFLFLLRIIITVQ